MRQSPFALLALALLHCAPATAPSDAALEATADSAVTEAATDALADLDAPDRSIDATATDAPSIEDVAAAPDDALDAIAADAAPRNPLSGIGTVERVRNGFMFVEGPQWRSREGDLLFSDIPANAIQRLREPMTFDVFRASSDNSNGLAIDAMGRLIAAEHGTRRVSRTRADGARETVAERFETQRLNSPNDVIVHSNGTIYFTDPPYGIAASAQELSFNGVFRVSPTGALTAEWRGARSTRPNGVALSPDERTLYVPDTATAILHAWDVAADGSLSRERTLTTTGPSPDGMAVDREGNLYISTARGVQVLSPSGAEWGVITVAEQPTNCAFGGADGRTLYITAQTGLYRVRTPIAGIY